MAVDSKWHQSQIEKYKVEFTHYEIYAKTLQSVLEAACGVYAPLAIVQARPKSVSSFAEKAVRKAFKYNSPVTQLTDLCGARVITDTQEAADRICAFIREHFCIDEANSLDVWTRLQTSEFGYLSFHYVVQVRAKEILGIKIPKEIGERKAEVQVRTLTQHAWANIAHDRIYKSQFNVPQPCKRALARLAALLEVADETFAEVVRTVDAYAIDYGAHMEPEARKAEIDMLEVVLRNEPKKANEPGIALRIAKVAKAAGEWQSIVDYLDPYLAVKSRVRPEVLREHGYALCRAHKAHPATSLYKQGQTELEAAVNEGEGNTRIQALSDLGWTHRNSPNQEVKARERYRQAFEYRLALALGATVGIVESSGRAATELLEDGGFWNGERLLWLANDPMTLRAFVKKALSERTPEEQNNIEKLGRTIHEKFLEENRYKDLDPVMMPWERLREDLKESNRDQAAYAVQALRRTGYGVRAATGIDAVSDFTPDEVEVMAEMEHGRWNVERLRAGWRYGPRRDSANRISPYLVSWKELPDGIKKWDRDAVRNWPKVFAEAGLEVYRL